MKKLLEDSKVDPSLINKAGAAGAAGGAAAGGAAGAAAGGFFLSLSLFFSLRLFVN